MKAFWIQLLCPSKENTKYYMCIHCHLTLCKRVFFLFCDFFNIPFDEKEENSFLNKNKIVNDRWFIAFFTLAKRIVGVWVQYTLCMSDK